MSTQLRLALESQLRAGPMLLREAVASVLPAVLIAWSLDRIERLAVDLEGQPELADDLHVAVAVGRGWLAGPSWRRSVAAREAGVAFATASPDPRLDARARLGAAALEACATIAESRAVRDAALDALVAAHEAIDGPLIDDPAARDGLAGRLGDETPRVDPPQRDVWSRRLTAALERSAAAAVAALELHLRLERLAAAWPGLFGPLLHAVSERLPADGSLLAGVLPWAPRRARPIPEPLEAERARSELLELVRRFRIDDLVRPPTVQRRPLAGGSVRAVRLVVADPRDGKLAAPFLAWLEPYAASGGALGHGQTMQFGSFVVRLRVVDGVLAFEVPDLRADPATSWTPILSEVLTVTTLQEQVVAALGVKGEPPRLDSTALVARGSERSPVELRRVSTPRVGDSGWELRPRAGEDEATVAGRIARTAQMVPLSEVVTTCPHVLPYLSLPPGSSVLWSAQVEDLPAVSLRGKAVEEGRLERAFRAVAGMRR